MELKENMIEYYGLSESDLKLTKSRYVSEKVKKNQFFLKKDAISGKIGFLKSGMLRTFFYDDNANETTTHFFQPDSVVISFDSFNNQVRSKENIIAVEDSELQVISYQRQKELYEIVPVWQQICKDISDKKSNDLIARSIQLQTLSATERYQQFCQQNPEVIKKVALRHIASYLGIDIATLSRIRKKM